MTKNLFFKRGMLSTFDANALMEKSLAEGRSPRQVSADIHYWVYQHAKVIFQEAFTPSIYIGCPLCLKYGGRDEECRGCFLVKIGQRCDNKNSYWRKVDDAETLEEFKKTTLALARVLRHR